MTDRMKVGELARRAGLSVRTLHHYDEIGLLQPAERTASGHRLYGPAEVRRLHQIASLRQVGLSLDAIAACLDRDGATLERTLDMQIERLREEMARQERLCGLLERLRGRLAHGGVGVEELTETIALTVRIESYYTPEQLQRLDRRARETPPGRMEGAQAEWTDLFAAFAEAMARGADPGSPEVTELARRARALIDEFTGGDPGVAASLNRMYRREGGPAVLSGYGMDLAPGLWDYMARARQALDAADEEATT